MFWRKVTKLSLLIKGVKRCLCVKLIIAALIHHRMMNDAGECCNCIYSGVPCGHILKSRFRCLDCCGGVMLDYNSFLYFPHFCIQYLDRECSIQMTSSANFVDMFVPLPHLHNSLCAKTVHCK